MTAAEPRDVADQLSDHSRTQKPNARAGIGRDQRPSKIGSHVKIGSCQDRLEKISSRSAPKIGHCKIRRRGLHLDPTGERLRQPGLGAETLPLTRRLPELAAEGVGQGLGDQ